MAADTPHSYTERGAIGNECDIGEQELVSLRNQDFRRPSNLEPSHAIELDFVPVEKALDLINAGDLPRESASRRRLKRLVDRAENCLLER